MRHADAVLLLSRVTGAPVRGPDGRGVGRLADLTVRCDRDADLPLVDRLVIRHGARTLLVPWAAVDAFDERRVALNTEDGFEVDSLAEALSPDEILLVRDVLDTQVVDVVGQRLTRVADVLLARVDGGPLELRGVEVGFGGVLRRLGLTALGTGFGGDVVAWPELHLTSERGHSVQLAAPRAALHRLDAPALAALLSRVDTDAATEILAAKEPGLAAAAVRAAHTAVGERVLRAMPESVAAQILAAMPGEHAEHWRHRLAHRSLLRSRWFLRSRVWPHRQHLIRGHRR